jgi:outer membrane biogenesis lipoprotein LolB
MKKTLKTSTALAAALLLTGCAAQRDAAETALINTMHETWPSINASSLRDIEYRQTTGEINQAGAELLTNRNLAFDEALGALHSSRNQNP